MGNSLHSFLTSIGAKLTQDSQCEFITSNTDDSNHFIAPLTHYGLLNIKGPDTATFLQGQTTANINNINDNCSLPGAYCTPKGRMISSFRVARRDQETYQLRMRRQIITNTQTVLSKYIVFSKAQQHDASDEFIILGMYGQPARTTIENTFGRAPGQQNETLIDNGNVIIQLDNEGLLYECWIQLSDINHLWPALSNTLTPSSSSAWELLLIRNGLGEVTEQTIETFIPQMLNYQITGEISFDKGCYTGQEIVARMHYRGKLKRQMYRIEISCAAPPPGTSLYRINGDQSIGTIVNSVNTDTDSCEALAVITIEDANSNQVTTGKDAPPVKILSLPYAIHTKDE